MPHGYNDYKSIKIKSNAFSQLYLSSALYQDASLSPFLSPLLSQHNQRQKETPQQNKNPVYLPAHPLIQSVTAGASGTQSTENC